MPTVGEQSPKLLLLKLPHGAWSVQEASENQLQLRMRWRVCRQSVLPAAPQDPCLGAVGRGGIIHADVCAGAALAGEGPSSAVPWIQVPGPGEHQSGWAGYAAVASDLESQSPAQMTCSCCTAIMPPFRQSCPGIQAHGMAPLWGVA